MQKRGDGARGPTCAEVQHDDLADARAESVQRERPKGDVESGARCEGGAKRAWILFWSRHGPFDGEGEELQRRRGQRSGRQHGGDLGSSFGGSFLRAEEEGDDAKTERERRGLRPRHRAYRIWGGLLAYARQGTLNYHGRPEEDRGVAEERCHRELSEVAQPRKAHQ